MADPEPLTTVEMGRGLDAWDNNSSSSSRWNRTPDYDQMIGLYILDCSSNFRADLHKHAQIRFAIFCGCWGTYHSDIALCHSFSDGGGCRMTFLLNLGESESVNVIEDDVVPLAFKPDSSRFSNNSRGDDGDSHVNISSEYA